MNKGARVIQLDCVRYKKPEEAVKKNVEGGPAKVGKQRRARFGRGNILGLIPEGQIVGEGVAAETQVTKRG